MCSYVIEEIRLLTIILHFMLLITPINQNEAQSRTLLIHHLCFDRPDLGPEPMYIGRHRQDGCQRLYMSVQFPISTEQSGVQWKLHGLSHHLQPDSAIASNSSSPAISMWCRLCECKLRVQWLLYLVLQSLLVPSGFPIRVSDGLHR